MAPKEPFSSVFGPKPYGSKPVPCIEASSEATGGPQAARADMAFFFTKLLLSFLSRVRSLFESRTATGTR